MMRSVVFIIDANRRQTARANVLLMRQPPNGSLVDRSERFTVALQLLEGSKFIGLLAA